MLDSDQYHLSSYRRGKPESNDIDIVITHPKADQKMIQELCRELTEVLSKKGFVTHLMSNYQIQAMSYSAYKTRKYSANG